MFTQKRQPLPNDEDDGGAAAGAGAGGGTEAGAEAKDESGGAKGGRGIDIKGFFKAQIDRLHQIRDAPHAVAGGVAIGIFWGFTPLTGLKTLLSIATAWACRFSRLSAVIAVALHDVLLPLWPVILRWEYQLGYWICNRPHQFPPKLMGHLLGHRLNLDHLLTKKTIVILWQTMVGSLVIGIPCALLTYWLTLKLLARYEARHHVHLKPPP